MFEYVLANDKATKQTYPMPAARAVESSRYEVLHDESPYDRNGRLRAPRPTPTTKSKASTPAAGKPKEASND